MKTTIKTLRKMIHEEITRLHEESDQSDIVMKLNGARELLSKSELDKALQALGDMVQVAPEHVQSILSDIIWQTQSQVDIDAPNTEPIIALIDKIIGMLHR